VDFSHSPKCAELLARTERFLDEHVRPLENEQLANWRPDTGDFRKWKVEPKVEALKDKARGEGLWNLFLPESHGGLNNRDYAPIAEAQGYYPLSPEIFNCNAPDTGNMEVLLHYGSDEQKERWLKPLLDGSMRSAFCMTEPEVASSDATNMQARILDAGDDIIVSGRKWWSTGVGHPNCKFAIFMGLTDTSADRYARHSMVIVPLDAKGVKIERMLPVFGIYDPPYGHGEVSFDEVRLPKSHVIAGLGRGFEIAQGRLGPGRVHHCMRAIGAAERALTLMIERAGQRVAFGKPLLNLGGNRDIIANSRMDIDMARLLILKAAYLLDTGGVVAAISEVSQIKVVAPNVACRVVDAALQMHGGKGFSMDTPIPLLYAYARALRMADGPDEVHRGVVARVELAKRKR
jgi:alkylation response protein AidB-like acyl-CoA dehydrogenase